MNEAGKYNLLRRSTQLGRSHQELHSQKRRSWSYSWNVRVILLSSWHVMTPTPMTPIWQTLCICSHSADGVVVINIFMSYSHMPHIPSIWQSLCQSKPQDIKGFLLKRCKRSKCHQYKCHFHLYDSWDDHNAIKVQCIFYRYDNAITLFHEIFRKKSLK